MTCSPAVSATLTVESKSELEMSSSQASSTVVQEASSTVIIVS